jgi:acetoin utilization deacetylase AcuC-like enzyme
MQVSVTGFAQMVEIIKGLGNELCNGRLVFSLEGGYNLRALAAFSLVAGILYSLALALGNGSH